MKIIEADFILTCNENFDILEDQALCFDDKILRIGTLDELKKEYKGAKVEKLPPNSVLMPALINMHTHLEFSANRTILEYGGFIKWLNSVMKNREEIMAKSDEVCMKNALNEILQSGTTTIGAISSMGLDMQVCKNSPARVVFFNEILGSQPDSVDVMFGDFKERLHQSEKIKDERFIPALSVHSPYSTHPILIKHALDLAKQKGLLVSAHFMESPAEREWLDSATGDFKEFFKPFNPNAKPFTSGSEFLELFNGCDVSFAHGVQTNEDELKILQKLNATLIHCPASNRLLGVGLFPWDKFEKNGINFTLGTDGRSSNISLNMWDEMRLALFSQTQLDIDEFAKKLLKGATCNAAKSLKLDIGEIKKGKIADMISFTLAQKTRTDQVPLHSILHTKTPQNIYIQGEKIAVD